MPWFFLDAHEPHDFRVGWLSLKKQQITRVTGRPDRLLPALSRAWQKHRHQAVGICVVSGPGSYSAIRIGVLHANLLSRLSGLPLVGITVDEGDDLPALVTALTAGRLPSVSYLAPIYGQEPNITHPVIR